MVKAKRVIWAQKAKKQLEEAYRYIKKDSYQNAELLRKSILASTRELAKASKLHRADKYKKENDGNYRAYEMHHYRIAYHVGENEITVVRFRHTRMEPSLY